jgi:hypothetical protein
MISLTTLSQLVPGQLVANVEGFEFIEVGKDVVNILIEVTPKETFIKSIDRSG